ncbi:MAG: preprotein translocase subunit SecG [Bacteroidota bacterium]
MFTVVLSLIILAAVLLVLVILAQNSKGGGLTSQFGGSGASNMIGVKKTGDLLEKLTWGLIIGIFVLTMSSNLLVDKTQQGPTDEFIERAGEQATPPAPIDLGTDIPSIDDNQIESTDSSDSQ